MAEQYGLTLAQTRSLLDKGFFEAARRCLEECGPYHFNVDEEHSVKGGSSKVDYVALVNNRPKVLCEAKSPSVMKDVGKLLPPHGIELKWVTGQSLVPKILSNVSVLFPVGYNICFKTISADRIVPGIEEDGMAVPYLPQLLDCVPSCEG